MPDKVIYLSPENPPEFHCPECKAEGEQVKLKFRYSQSEQWGTCVSRHDFYSCKMCKARFVSTNGSEPDLTSL